MNAKKHIGSLENLFSGYEALMELKKPREITLRFSRVRACVGMWVRVCVRVFVRVCTHTCVRVGQ